MPGPLSRAMIWIPAWPLSWARTIAMTISPSRAYSTMLRESSEIAVAIEIWSVEEKPIFEAIARPRWRAVTMSLSCEIATVTSSCMRSAGFPHVVQDGDGFLEVERGPHVGEREPQLDHRERDLGLDADDDGLGAAHLENLADAAQRPDRERIHDVEHRDVDDDALRPELPDPLRQVVAEAEQVRVRERRLDAGDQVVPLLEDRNFHGAK